MPSSGYMDAACRIPPVGCSSSTTRPPWKIVIFLWGFTFILQLERTTNIFVVSLMGSLLTFGLEDQISPLSHEIQDIREAGITKAVYPVLYRFNGRK